MLHRVLPLGFCLATTACGGELYGSGPLAPSQPSGYSSSVGSSASSSESVSVSVAQRPGPNELVVRPDSVEIAFALEGRGVDADKLLARSKEQAEAILQRLKAVSGAVDPKMCGSTVTPIGNRKFRSADSPETFRVHVDGSVDIPLRPELDYWARSRLLAALGKVTREIAVAAKTDKGADADGADKASDGPLEIGFSEPRLRVKDVEPYRERLLARWMARTKKLLTAVESERAPLAVVDCTPPGDIEQRVISLEEISLALPISCRVGVPGVDRSRAP